MGAKTGHRHGMSRHTKASRRRAFRRYAQPSDPKAAAERAVRWAFAVAEWAVLAMRRNAVVEETLAQYREAHRDQIFEADAL